MRVSLLPTAAFVLAAAAPAQTTYTDVSIAAGLGVNHDPLYTASFAAGGAVGDFDNDGWTDIYLPVGGTTPDRLFINNGDGTFTDRAAAWGIDASHRGTAATVGDYDGDGWLDLFVTSLGPANANQVGAHRLYHNEGNGMFTERAAQLNLDTSSTSVPDGWGGAFGDFDLDGDLDLCVAGWLSNNGNRVYRNDGSTFTDVTSLFANIQNIAGFAPRWCDMDGDRYPELIFIGDFSTSEYYVNNAGTSFTNFTAGSGTSQDGTEMGFTIADWDEDGDWDFYVTTISTNNLYVNQGGHVYLNQANQTGTNDTAWGWGATTLDIDNDSRFDIAVTTQSNRQYVFHNTGTAPLTFDEVALSIGVNTNISGRGIANLDYDNDGDQDLVFFPHNGALKLFRNDLSGPDRHWLRVFLDRGANTLVAPNGIGSVVKASFGGRTLMSRIDGGSNYMSMSELSAHFGLGAVTVIDELRIEWTDGSVTTLEDVAADQTLTITAPTEFELFCAGDGGDQAGCTDCPCGNNAAGGPGGCLNGAGRSGRLAGVGNPSVAADGLRLFLRDANSLTFGVLSSAQNRLPNLGPCAPGSGIAPANLDGLRCIGGSLQRHGSRSLDANGDSNNPWGPPGNPSGGLIAQGSFGAGQTRQFQVFYREDPALSCGQGQNTSNAVSVTFVP